MFDLTCDDKGYFPHFFNTAANWDYNGQLPDTSFYGCNSFKADERSKFLSWYQTQVDNNKRFNLQDELENYCKQDVNILRLACLKFRKIFLTENGIDPFLQCVTIASACMKTFRKNFIKEDTIGIIPAGGYRLKDKQSKIALKWLRWLEHSLGKNIQHAGNGREARICNFKVCNITFKCNTSI